MRAELPACNQAYLVMEGASHSMRLAVITNIIAPYRTPVLRELAARVQLRVFYSVASEANRQWSVTRELPFDYEIIGGPSIRTSGTSLYPNPRLLTRLWAFDPSVVIAGGFSLPALYALAYCRIRNAKLIILSEGTSHSERNIGPMNLAARSILLRASSACVAISTSAKQRFRDLGVATSRCVVAPYALDLSYRPTHIYDPGTNNVRLLYVGQFIERKGVLELLHAIAQLRSDHQVTLTLVGHGPLEDALRNTIAAYNLDSCVHLRGFVDQAALPQLYAEHDLFVFPSLEDTFGVVLLEAMAAGVAPVASRLAGATNDFVAHGLNGWVIDEISVTGIAAALSDALMARTTWDKVGNAARRKVEEQSPQRVANEILRAVNLASSCHST